MKIRQLWSAKRAFEPNSIQIARSIFMSYDNAVVIFVHKISDHVVKSTILAIEKYLLERKKIPRNMLSLSAKKIWDESTGGC